MMLISDRIQLVVAAAAAQAAAASVGSAAVVPAAVCGDDVWPECGGGDEDVRWARLRWRRFRSWSAHSPGAGLGR